MIKQASEHLANERTWLAWIRTGIAIMAFGFLVERFNIFLSYVGRSMGASALVHGQSSARFIGVGLIGIGIVALLHATVRYVRRDAAIADPEPRTHLSVTPNVLLGVLLAAIGIFLVAYLMGVGS